MAWVRAEFFHTWTHLIGLDPLPRPSPFTKWVFYLGPKPAPRASLAQANLDPIRCPNRGPTKLKKKIFKKNELKPKFIFA